MQIDGCAARGRRTLKMSGVVKRLRQGYFLYSAHKIHIAQAMRKNSAALTVTVSAISIHIMRCRKSPAKLP